MRDAARAVQAASEARDLCLALRRTFAGPRALAALRTEGVEGLSPEEIRLGLGLAWGEGNLALVRQVLAGLGPARVEADPILLAFRHAAG